MSKYGCSDPDINDLKHGYVNVLFYSTFREMPLAFRRILPIDVKVWFS